MAFNNEDQLSGHKRIDLHLGIDSSTTTTEADQTPTPTRFIRNCEEVGLFQDLQNVNPFEETFRQATELAKNGSLHIPEASSDDSLHTPNLFPHIEELANGNDNTDCHYTITNQEKCKTPRIIVNNSSSNLITASGNNDDEGVVKLKLKEALTTRNKPDVLKRVKHKTPLENNEKKEKLTRISNKEDKNNLLKRSYLEIKREINRNAQSRSRERKKHHYRQLGDEVVLLRSEVTHLSKENQKLKDEVAWLKTILLYHKDCPVSQDPKVAEEVSLLKKLAQETTKRPIESPSPAKQVVSILPHPQTFIALPSVILQVPTTQTSSPILTSYASRVLPKAEVTKTTKVVTSSTTKNRAIQAKSKSKGNEKR